MFFDSKIVFESQILAIFDRASLIRQFEKILQLPFGHISVMGYFRSE